ncbi:MAG: hypothetical protein IJR40_09510, partial [Treponema sp.]|nr:hypothetical protein [Treponema sp.]
LPSARESASKYFPLCKTAGLPDRMRRHCFFVSFSVSLAAAFPVLCGIFFNLAQRQKKRKSKTNHFIKYRLHFILC